MSVQLAAGGKAENRRALDFYPTPPDVTHALMLELSLPACVVWEPACGDGAMAEVIASYGHKVVATDIRDTGYGQGGVDFLKASRECDAIITNPPFNLSEGFIRHALTLAPIVAMLLKSQYWHAQKRLPLFNEFLPAKILPLTWRPDFLNGERGGAPTMECLWTVWFKGQHQTSYKLLSKPQTQQGLFA